MSKIYQIQPNSQPKSKLSQSQPKILKNPSFGKLPEFLRPKAIGDYADLKDKNAIKVAQACERKIVGWGTKLGEFLSINDSEIEKQLINAAFTSTLAPFMIGWNPFSKQDEKTKKYMALRQPISAVIAIAGGITLTKPIEDWLSKVFSEGNVSSLDMRMAPDKDYLKRQIRKTDYKGKFRLNKAEKKKLAADVENKQTEIREFFAELLLAKDKKAVVNNGKVEILDENGKVKTIIDEKTKKTTTFSRVIPNITNQTELDNYLKENSLHERPFGDFMKENLGFEFYDDGVLKPENTKTKLKDTKAMDLVRSFGFKDIDETKLKKATAIVRQDKETVKQLEGAYANCDVKSKPNLKKMVEANGQQASSIVETHLGEVASKEETLTVGQLFHRFGYDGKKLQELMGEKTYVVLEAFKEHLKSITTGKQIEKDGVKIDETIGNKETIEFVKNIIKDKAGKLDKQFSKAYKGYFSILSNLFIVAVTCTALNWAYPRVVEKFFPRLVKNDKPSDAKKGGNK